MKKSFIRFCKAHAYLQTMIKTHVKDQPKTVGEVALTRYLLQTWNHAPQNSTTENQKLCPLAFL